MDKDFIEGHVDRFIPVVWGVYFARQVMDFIHLCKHQFCWHDQWMFKMRKQVTAGLRILNRTMKVEMCVHVWKRKQDRWAMVWMTCAVWILAQQNLVEPLMRGCANEALPLSLNTSFRSSLSVLSCSCTPDQGAPLSLQPHPSLSLQQHPWPRSTPLFPCKGTPDQGAPIFPCNSTSDQGAPLSLDLGSDF